MKIFSKTIQPKCEYCRRALLFDNCDVLGCKYHGIMTPDEQCRRFVYDPLKREPDPPAVFLTKSFDTEEFEL